MFYHEHPLMAVLLRVGTEVVVTLRSLQREPEARVFRVDGRKACHHRKSTIFAPDENLALGICVLETTPINVSMTKVFLKYPHNSQ